MRSTMTQYPVYNQRKWRKYRKQKRFVVDLGIANGKFKNLNKNFNCLLLLKLSVKNWSIYFVPVILIFEKDIA